MARARMTSGRWRTGFVHGFFVAARRSSERSVFQLSVLYYVKYSIFTWYLSTGLLRQPLSIPYLSLSYPLADLIYLLADR